MAKETQKRVYELLRQMQRTFGMEPLKRLFWTELNYDRVNEQLSRRNWPELAHEALAEDPIVLAEHRNSDDRFEIVYCRLEAENLLLTKERPVITQLLSEHPYRMFVFSNSDQNLWHFVNVKYDKNERARRLFRRITIGPHERLRTASERIARLDIASMDRDLFGLSALAIQNAHDTAFDVEAVTQRFFEAYKQVFEELQADLAGQTSDPSWAHDYALQLLNRIMFLYFVQRKLWLAQDPDFLNTFWRAYQEQSGPSDTFYAKWLQILFFEAFNNRFPANSPDRQYFPSEIHQALADAPYLNGGLFKPNDLDSKYQPYVSDQRFLQMFEFFEGYNFTIREDTPLDQEVAVDPEMIGKVYESLVNVSEEADERGEAGIFYTPRTEIDLMCRLSLVDWLSNRLDGDLKPLLYDTVFAFDEAEKRTADEVLRTHNLWPTLREVLSDIQVVDPACGSGSFLVGMLHVLDDLLARADAELGYARMVDDRRRDIIGRSLYGVDVMEWAIHVAELRLWLQLVIETEISPHKLKLQPLLPNLSFNLRTGDSLVQEVGDMNLAMRHGELSSDPEIAGRVNHLKGEKLKYYNNQSQYASANELRRVEFDLFCDILEKRAAYLEKRIGDLEGWLRPQVNLFGEVTNPQTTLDQAKLQNELKERQAEFEQVQHAQRELENAESVPFIWDIAFVEVFSGEQRGFDIVIGNPPYVRQEEIHDPRQNLDEVTAESKKVYKGKLARSVYSAWPQSFGSKWKLNAKSDLYIYFYFYGLSLLNEYGTFCFVTSNSWLDVGYGQDLQEFLLTRSQVRLVIDNQVRRSFASADVNTVITLFGVAEDRPDKCPHSLNNTARFVMFRVPFEVVLSSGTWRTISEISQRKTTDEWRVYIAKQNELLLNGMDTETQVFSGDKWGGRYLRAPEIYWDILEKKGDLLVQLGDIAEVRRGFTTGANEFFYVSQDTAFEWGIEAEFLVPAIKSPRECNAIWLEGDTTSLFLFMCHSTREELQGTRALEYIRYGESQGYHKRPTCRTRQRWWDLGVRSGAKINCNYLIDEVMRFFGSDTPFFVSDNFQEVHSSVPPAKVLAACNCTITQLFVNVMGRSNFGDGLLKLQTYEVRSLIIPNPNLLSDEVRRTVKSSGMLNLQDSDRQRLDELVFDALRLTTDERDAVADAVDNLVSLRLEKAGSLDSR